MIALACLLAVAFNLPADCVPQPAPDMPILLVWYDPGLGGWNCDDSCHLTANGSLITEESYQKWAACPFDWVGWTVVVPYVGEFYCADTGGLVHPQWNEHYGRWVVVLDVLSHAPPPYHYWLTEGWTLR